MPPELESKPGMIAALPQITEREHFLKWLGDLDTRGAFILINKNAGPTSFDAIRTLKRFFREEAKRVGINLKERDMPKLGHIGTLDPFATGLLCILCGPSVKLTRYLVGHSKRYIATLKFGEKTDSGDLDGAVVSKQDVPPTCFDPVHLRTVFQSFTNTAQYIQTAPLASAKKVDGKRLYETYHKQRNLNGGNANAENSIQTDLPVNIERPQISSQIFELKTVTISEQTQSIQFEVKCSSGTYVRVLGEDIAEKLHTCGHLTNLHRTEIADISVTPSTPLDGLVQCESFKSMNELFAKIHDIQLMPVTDDEARMIYHGNVHVLPQLKDRADSLQLMEEHVFVYKDNEFETTKSVNGSNNRLTPFAVLRRNEAGKIEFETFLFQPS